MKSAWIEPMATGVRGGKREQEKEREQEREAERQRGREAERRRRKRCERSEWSKKSERSEWNTCRTEIATAPDLPEFPIMIQPRGMKPNTTSPYI